MAAKSPSNEIRLARVFDAPVQAVWDAWTDPEQVAQWWGPRGFTLTTHSKDLRPGGHWKYTMHGPDGTDYPNKTLYYEVEPGRRLVYDHGGNDDRPPMFRVTVEFEEIAGQTHMNMRLTFSTPEAAAEARKFIKSAGGDSTWDRLGEYLVGRSSGQEVFVINRSFDAPRELVFDMWTDVKHLARWLPTAGAQAEFLRADIRPGGSTFFRIRGPGDLQLFARAEYLEIERPARIVYTQQICDEQEQPAHHPMLPVWPATLLTVVQFAEEGPDQTRVTVTWAPHDAATAAEIAAFVQARAGMSQGWTGSFDKLEELLPTA